MLYDVLPSASVVGGITRATTASLSVTIIFGYCIHTIFRMPIFSKISKTVGYF